MRVLGAPELVQVTPERYLSVLNDRLLSSAGARQRMNANTGHLFVAYEIVHSASRHVPGVAPFFR